MHYTVVRSIVVALVLQILLGHVIVEGGILGAFSKGSGKVFKSPAFKQGRDIAAEQALDALTSPDQAGSETVDQTNPNQTDQQSQGLTSEDLALLAKAVNIIRADTETASEEEGCKIIQTNPQTYGAGEVLFCNLFMCVIQDPTGDAETVGQEYFLGLLAFDIQRNPYTYQEQLCSVQNSPDCDFYRCVRNGSGSDTKATGNECYTKSYAITRDIITTNRGSKLLCDGHLSPNPRAHHARNIFQKFTALPMCERYNFYQ